MGEIERIKRLVSYYKKIYGTNNPFEIADHLGILYQIGNCKHEGCYMFLKNHRYIFLSNRLSGVELKVVMAHEFAAHLLIDDDLLEYYEDFTREQFCNCTGFPKELIELRLKQKMQGVN